MPLYGQGGYGQGGYGTSDGAASSLPAIQIAELINDPDFAQNFIIYRSNGSFVAGNWVNSSYQIASYGIIQPLSDNDIAMIPEGDSISGLLGSRSLGGSGTIAIWSTSPINITHSTGLNDYSQAASDQIVWQGVFYRVLSVKLWVDFGYYRAIAVRMAGE